MADGETLNIRIDYATEQALNNAAALTAAMDRQREAFKTTGVAVERLEENLQDLNATVRRTTDATDEATRSARNATDAVNELNEAVGRNATAAGEDANALARTTDAAGETAAAGQRLGNVYIQINESSLQLVSTTNNFASSLTQVNQSLNTTQTTVSSVNDQTDRGADSVNRWLAQFLSITAILKLLEELRDRIKEINDAMDALADRQAGSFKDNKRLARTFGVSETSAEYTVQDVSTRSGASREVTRSALIAVGTVGGDPTVKNSADESRAVELATAAQVYDLKPETVARLAKVDAQSGGGTAQSLKVLIDKIIAAAPRGTDPGQFIDSATSNVLAEVARGQSTTNPLAIFGSLVEASKDPAAAAAAYKQIRQLAERGNAKADEFFAAKAVDLGMISPAAVTTADADAVNGVADKRTQLAFDRLKLGDDTESVALRKKKLTADRAAASGKLEKPAQRAAENIKFQNEALSIQRAEQGLQRDQSAIDKQARELEDATKKAIAAETTRRQLAAYANLNPNQRLERVILPVVGAATTDDEKKKISEITGVRQADGLFELARLGEKAITDRVVDVANASGQGYADDAKRYGQTEESKNVRNQAANEARQINSSGFGVSYMRRLLKDAFVTRQQAAGSAKTVDFSSIDKGLMTLATNQDTGVTQEAARQLKANVLAALKNNPTPAQERELIDLLSSLTIGGAGHAGKVWNDEQGRAELERYAVSFGELQHRMEVDKNRSRPASAPRPASPPPKTATPSTQPPAGAHADAGSLESFGSPAVASAGGATHHHHETYNSISVGSYYPAAFEDDLPGALETVL